MKSKNKEYDIPRHRVVTLNVDSCPAAQKINGGGWAVWITHNEGKLLAHAPFKVEVHDSNMAELMGVTNGLHLLEPYKEHFDMVIINCDNNLVRDIINKRKLSDKFKVVGEQMFDYLRGYKKSRAKTINGHQSNHNARQYVNNWCDEHCSSPKSMLKKLGPWNF